MRAVHRGPPFRAPRNMPLSPHNLRVAVKTHAGNHHRRVHAFVKRSWTTFMPPDTVRYYSNAYDPTLPARNMKVRNVPKGHGEKLFKALHDMWDAYEEDEEVEWFLVVDDDTVLNVPALLGVLERYDSREPVHLGQMWGRRHQYLRNVSVGNPVQRTDLVGMDERYDFHGFGAGAVFSRPALELFVDYVEEMEPDRARLDYCARPDPDTMDDVWIGQCMGHLGVPVVHVDGMFSLWSDKYHSEQLAARDVISLHGGPARMDGAFDVEHVFDVYRIMLAQHRDSQRFGFH